MRIQRLRAATMTSLHVDAHLSSYSIHHRGAWPVSDAANRHHDASTIPTATHQRRAPCARDLTTQRKSDATVATTNHRDSDDDAPNFYEHFPRHTEYRRLADSATRINLISGSRLRPSGRQRRRPITVPSKTGLRKWQGQSTGPTTHLIDSDNRQRKSAIIRRLTVRVLAVTPLS